MTRPRTVPTAAVAALVVAIGVVRYAVVANPTRFLWWEDGSVFLPEAERGFTMAPYAGYLHLVPRVGAWLVSLAPRSVAPSGFIAVIAVVAAFCAVVTWLASAEVVPTLGWRLVATLAYVAVPLAGHDAMMTATFAQWWLVVAACWATLLPARHRGLAFVAGALAGLSCALLPLALVPVVVAGRTWRHPAVLGSLLWVVQVPFVLSAERVRTPGHPFLRFTGEGFGGGMVARDGTPAVAGLLLLVVVVVVACRGRLGAGFAVAGVVLFVVGSGLNGQPTIRYAVSALVLLAGAVAINSRDLPRWVPLAVLGVWSLSLPARFYEAHPAATWQQALRDVPCVDGTQTIPTGPTWWPVVVDLDC